MKVCLVVPSFYPAVIYGGPIFSTLNASRELTKLDDIDLTVSTTNANMTNHLEVETDRLVEIEQGMFVKYYNDTWINKLSIPLLLKIWRDIKQSDLVHIQAIFSTPTPISLLYAKLFGKPVLLSPRGSFAPWVLDQGKSKKEHWLNYVIRPFIRHVAWHATSEQEKNEILALFPGAEVFIIPNGIDQKEYTSVNILSKKDYVIKYTHRDLEPENVIISMGRLHAKKGFDILIDAFHKFCERSPNSVLMIAGDDETEKANLERQIRDLGLEDKVFLVGSVSGQDKIDFLANADLFVLPSHNENFGNVYVESLAAGTPIVASTNTPWSGVVEADCGLWVENSVETTAEAIGKMLEKDRQQLSANSKQLAHKYRWSNIAEEFKRVFSILVDKRSIK